MEPTTLDREIEIDRALCRGLLYETLARALRRPSAASLATVREEEAAEALSGAAAAIEAGQEGGPVAAAVADLIAAAAGAEIERLEISHQRLFGHTAQGKVPPYETEYGPGDLFRQSQELADIGGFYGAFGLAIDASRHERGDHIGAECEFLSFLAYKEAWELEGENPAALREVRRSQKLFLRDHAGRFGRAFARALAREAGDPFYRAAGDLCFAFLTAECERAGVRPGPEFLQLRPAEEADVPMACGSCPLADLAAGGGDGAGRTQAP
jgi:TorA maturation chaperone TorD